MPTDIIPVIRVLPSTINAVVAVPVLTTTPSLKVPRPIESTFFTSSYVNTPPTDKLPEIFALPVSPSVEPSNVKLPLSVNVLPDPTMTTRLSVRVGILILDAVTIPDIISLDPAPATIGPLN